jgi:hypothetical protein
METTDTRNVYGAIITHHLEQTSTVKAVLKTMKELDNAQRTDEHGAWTTGIVSTSNRSGVSVNVALYGFTRWRRRCYAVVQVRQCEFHPTRYSRIRKDYYLIGRNENRRPFAHPIPYGPVRSAVNRDPENLEAPVLAAMAWIWGIKVEKLSTVARNGDTALIPELPRSRDTFDLGRADVQVIDSHMIRADSYRVNGEKIWALNASLTHDKGQHPEVSVSGWARVAIGKRVSNWSFSSPTAD